MSAYERGFEAGKREAGCAKNETITGLAKNIRALTQRTEVLTAALGGSIEMLESLSDILSSGAVGKVAVFKQALNPPPEGE